MVRRWHCRSCPWRFCLVTDTRMICTDHPTRFPVASLVPGRMIPACSKPRDTPEPVLLGGWQERSVEGGEGRRRRSRREKPRSGRGPSGRHPWQQAEVVQVAAAGVHVPWAVSRPRLELHGAGGQAVIAESVVTQVVDQPVHTLGERGQVLEGRGTAAAQPHPTPQITPTPPVTPVPQGVRSSENI